MIAIGGPKKPPKEEDEAVEKDPSEDEGSEMDSYLDEAFDALQEQDKEAFKLALKGALECM